MSQTYDVAIIGGGSVGLPIAFNLAEKKYSICVIDSEAGPGQGQNKAAIGGIRATHSEFSKIWLCQEALNVFQSWKEIHGTDIGWLTGGYCFPCYSEKMQAYFKKLVELQKTFGLNINYISSKDFKELVPGINDRNLLGGTYSPEDGFASPMLSSMAFYNYSKSLNVNFYFKEEVVDFVKANGEIQAIKTNKNIIHAKHIILAAGANARDIGRLLNLDIPVYPDCHEAGITEPVKRFFTPMIVDIRAEKNSKNYYFYQNHEGQVVFCITPEPPIVGKNRNSTSEFLPLVAKRMVDLYPRLANLKVRRTWRGLYPMTPDGLPIISEIKELTNLKLAVGMCGQGFMLGPGIGRLFGRWFTDSLNENDKKILSKLTLYGNFSEGTEELK